MFPKNGDQPTTTADEEAERKRREKLRREQERKQEQTKTLLITLNLLKQGWGSYTGFFKYP